MNNSDERHLRDALQRESSQYGAGELSWDEVLLRTQTRSWRTRWRLPAALAAAVVLIAVTVGIVAANRSSTHSPPAAGATTSPTPTTASALRSTSVPSSMSDSSTGPGTTTHEAASSTAPATTGQILSSGPGFPAPSIAPPTLLTSVAANSDPNKVDLSWATHGDALLVTTFGSSSCPRAVEQVIRTGPRSIRLVLTAPYAAAQVSPPSGAFPHICLDDLRPYTSIVRPPTGIAPSSTLDVTIDQTAYHLPAR